VHELGHFAASRVFQVFVSEISLGFGPIIKRFKIGDTSGAFPEQRGVNVAWRALPFGGSVRYPDLAPEGGGGGGEEKKNNDSLNGSRCYLPSNDDPDRLENKPVWQRVIIALAGIAANVLAAWGALLLLLSGSAMEHLGEISANIVRGMQILASTRSITSGEYSFLQECFHTSSCSVSGGLYSFASANIYLAIFNMLPLLFFDGGEVIRLLCLKMGGGGGAILRSTIKALQLALTLGVIALSPLFLWRAHQVI